MGKIGRNDSCTCGSGLKYKKCCGKNNVIAFNPLQYEEELEKLNFEMVKYAFERFEREISESTLDYMEMFTDGYDDKAGESFAGLLAGWIIFNEPIEQGQTIFEVFSQRKVRNIKKPRVKKAFLSWENAISSIFKIVLIDDQVEKSVTIQDVTTNERYRVLQNESDNLNVGDFIAGTILPALQSWQFVFMTLEIANAGEQFTMGLLAEFDFEEGSASDFFPEIAAGLLRPFDEELEWISPLHEGIANLYALKMNEKAVDADCIREGILFWNFYTLKYHPKVTKVETYVAALDYFTQQMLMHDSSITQASLAKEYDVSAATISTHFRRFMHEYELEDDSPKILMQNTQETSFDLEREMSNIHKMIEDSGLDSIEDVKELLDNEMKNKTLKKQKSDTAEDKAYDLLSEANNKHGAERTKLINKALQIDPANIDARIFLAGEVESDKEKCDLLLEAKKIGETQLGKDFFKENKGHFWGLIETRPFMRAMNSLAYLLSETGRVAEAVEMYGEMLILNPNDNQGIRNVLLPLYIEVKDYRSALELIDRFGEYPETDHLFSRALIGFLVNGGSVEFIEDLRKASKKNPFVLEYLLGESELPWKDLPHVEIGGRSEAIAFAQSNIHLWTDAIEYLKGLE